MMDKKTEEQNLQDLLRSMAEVQRRNQRLSVIATAAILVFAAALLVSLALVVPKLSATLTHARSTLGDSQQIIQRINASLDQLDTIGEKLDGLTGDGAENLGKLIDTVNALDLDALTESIQSFKGVLERLTNFRLFG